MSGTGGGLFVRQIRRYAAAGLMLCLAAIPAGCGDLDDGDETPPAAPILNFVASTDAEVATANADALKLDLNTGERFPLIKRVEQTLSQRSGGGSTLSQSNLELEMELSVDEVRPDGHRRLSVRYHRVRYTYDLDGERIEYDSSLPYEPIPASVIAYRGLVENGFSFWIGPDNRVTELVGFDEFLKRCVGDVSLQNRKRVLSSLATSSVEDAIAGFIDESVGLLLYPNGEKQSQPQSGATWTRVRKIDQPVPLRVSQRYTLTELNDQLATIDIVGTLSPAATLPQAPGTAAGVNVSVRRGHVLGSSSIDRRTGLPVHSRVERRVEMVVELAGGEKFDQTKRTVTTLRALPQKESVSSQPSDFGQRSGRL